MSDITQESVNMMINVSRFCKEADVYMQEMGDTPTVKRQKEMNKSILAARADLKFAYKEWENEYD